MNLYLKDLDKFKKVLLLVTIFSIGLIVLSTKNYYDNKIDGDYGYNIVYPEGKNIKLNSLNTSVISKFNIISFNNADKDLNYDLVLNIKNNDIDLDKVRITLKNNDKEYNIIPKNNNIVVENLLLRKNTKLKEDNYEINIRYLDTEPIFGDVIEDSIGIIEDDSSLELSVEIK